MEFVFDRNEYIDELKEFDQFIEEKKNMDGALMPVLQKAQNLFSYLPREIIEEIAKKLSLPVATVYGVATFYAQFTFIPMGKNRISICMGTACYVKGAEDLIHAFEDELGIKKGETTPDKMFSIIETRCVGECAVAPVVTINDENIGHYEKKMVKKTIKELRGKQEGI